MELSFIFNFRGNGRVAEEFQNSHRTLDTLSHAQRAINSRFEQRTAQTGWAHSSRWSYDWSVATSRVDVADYADPEGFGYSNGANLRVTREGGVDRLVISHFNPEWLGCQPTIQDELVACLTAAGFELAA